MFQIIFAFLAGVVTIAAPCTLPLLPVLLGTSLGKNNKLRPIFIVLGFVVIFTGAALILSLLARYTGFNTNIVRTIGIFILGIFGSLMLWSKP